ncbi:MAG: TfoX/Sxy family protein, partial [Woeseiaceae bacterium]
MAYDEGIAERIREIFDDRPDMIEKKMFGGIAFLHSGNMCCGITDDMLMARVGPDAYEDAMQRPHTREMDFTGKSL